MKEEKSTHSRPNVSTSFRVRRLLEGEKKITARAVWPVALAILAFVLFMLLTLTLVSSLYGGEATWFSF